MDKLKALLTSRRRVFLITLGLLLLFDLGRSIYARVGSAEPSEVWRPDPQAYTDMTWPPGADLPADTPTGQRIYMQHCALCHGPAGRGNGPASPALTPRPRDFTLGQFKYKSTLPGQPPSDADLINVVTNGLHASAMPYWKGILSDADIRQVVSYVKTFSPVFDNASLQAITIPPRVTPDAASIGRGKNLFTAQGCTSCHGNEARGSLTLKDAKGFPVISRDLTAPWTFRGGSEPEQIYLRLTTGLAPGPMPSFADKTTPEGRWDLVNYVLSLARTPPWEAGGKFDGPRESGDLTKRGDYIVHSEMCGICHTPVDAGGIYNNDQYLAGGQRVQIYPHGIYFSRNLTSDPETGLGSWSEQEIADAFRNGQARGRTLLFFDMPWFYLHKFSDGDALAIAHYLKTVLPPVHNAVPLPLHFGVAETIIGKLERGLPVAPPATLTYTIGDYAQTGAGLPRDLPQTVLIDLQWLALLAGIVAFIFIAPRERRFPLSWRGWILTILALLGLLVLFLIGWLLNDLPATPLLPPAQIVQAATSGIPAPDPATLNSPEQAALVARGQYLFTTASCALCHTSNGAGGQKNNIQGMGSVWSRNLTSDPVTGLGAWSDAEIARAIRSGVGRSGRTLYWQAMPWDHLSNLGEEDVRAVIAYLRTLPPVNRQIPNVQPPGPNDCPVLTIWIDTDLKPGCQ